MLTAVKLPEFTAVKPPSPGVEPALGDLETSLSSLLDKWLSCGLAASGLEAAGGEKRLNLPIRYLGTGGIFSWL